MKNEGSGEEEMKEKWTKWKRLFVHLLGHTRLTNAYGINGWEIFPQA